MVTVLPDPSGIAQGITGAGSALAQALQTRGERQQQLQQQQQVAQQQQQHGTILNNIIGNLPEDASPLQITQAMSQAVAQGVPPEMVQNASTLYNTLQRTAPKQVDVPDVNEMAGLFKRFGMPDEEAYRNAELYSKLTAGGQTEMARMLIDKISRGQQSISPGQPQLQSQQADVTKEEVSTHDFPEVDMFKGLTTKEKVGRQKELFNTNAKDFTENTNKLRATEDEIRRIQQMKRINDSGKLPTGLERLNINWTTGDIKIPALANAETQLFVKAVNDFTVKAKDTFGARVTNFELGTFMRRLPTLANTEEGRRLILEQMEAVSALNQLYHDSLNETYDHYGLRGIDKQKTEKVANDLRSDKEKKLIERYNNAYKAQEIYEARQLAPEGKVPATDPEGRTVYIWRNQADKAEKRGYRIQ